ncbi:MAG: histidine phosphatase family protein [Candidatus Binataceae bacterium]
MHLQLSDNLVAMGKLIMIRHGESEGNRDRRFTISPDVPITELGRRQALEAATLIARRFHPRLIISSPFRRARQTSEIIGESLKLPIEVVFDLHERDLGHLKGESYDALHELARKDPVYNPSQGWLWKPEGGESYEDVRQRVVAAIEQVRTRYPDDELVVVSHGGVMLSMWAHVIGHWDGAHLPANCGIVLIEHDRSGYQTPVPIAN